jgi:hypothetical protein
MMEPGLLAYLITFGGSEPSLVYPEVTLTDLSLCRFLTPYPLLTFTDPLARPIPHTLTTFDLERLIFDQNHDSFVC